MNNRKKLLLCSLFMSILFICRVSVGAENSYEDTYINREIQGYCEEIGERYNICPELLMAVIEAESSGNPGATGADGDVGLMQIIPKYHSDRMEVLAVRDLFDSRQNILTAADYLAELFAKYEDVGTVLMVYNGTADAIKKGQAGDLSDYAASVLARAAELERVHGK